ncbi:MAG: L-seryl-tRNA(Sec) selenium transferase [Kiritimatiellia bacterium]|jgi:L-seryl-tRNA(Ser) seleniumtransferase
MSKGKNPARGLPAVQKVLEEADARGLVARFGHGEVVSAIRAAVAAARGQLLAGAGTPSPSAAELLAEAAQRLEASDAPRLKPAVNATGILLHTGLGRAPMARAAREAVASVMGCCNLQMDMDDGSRIHREHAVRGLVCSLTGAEDVVLVNNNAAATLLVISALAHGKEIVVSRGELIEIGGSFRLPEIMQQGGARMREVGTTNKTHLRDYEQAVSDATALLLKVHKSNYEIIGFTQEVGIADIAGVGRRHGIPVVDDLGCGAMVPLERFGLPHEMTIAESLAAGADLVLASTDKLIGGPQGGLVVGRAELIARVRRHPLYRVFRVCKMTLAALEATLRLFRNPENLPRTHPLYAMLAKTPEETRHQAGELAAQLRPLTPFRVDVVEHESFLGGGSLPARPLASHAVVVATTGQANEFARALRACRVPVCARIHDGAIYLDMRTVSQEECAHVVEAFRETRGGAA